MSTYTQFNISKTDFESTTLRQMSLPRLDELSDDCLLVEVERFAFTANNITYAMLGDVMKYWQLFKAPDGFGNIDCCWRADCDQGHHGGHAGVRDAVERSVHTPI